MEGGHQLSVFQLEEELGQPGDPGGRDEVSDIRFHRAQGAEAPVRCVASKGPGQPFDLDGIPQSRAGAVGLDVGNGAGVDPGVQEGGLDQLRLGGGIGHRVPAGTSPGVDSAAPNDPIDVVAVPLGLVKGFEEHRRHPFGIYEASRPIPEGLFLRSGEQHILLAELDHPMGVQGETDPTGQSDFTFPSAEALEGQVNCRQGGRTSRIDGHARPMEVEEVGHPIGDVVGVRIRALEVPFEGLFHRHQGVGIGGQAGEDARLRP